MPEERRLIFKHIDEVGYTSDIDCYLRHGGYETLRKAVAQSPEDLREEVKKSGLRGRGGAGFPCGVKWSLVDRKSGKPIYLIVNADESEPGTFKDRYIIHQDPHQLIEGIMISCFANGVKQAYIYIRGEFPHGAKILERAIAEARAKNFVGPNILGTDYSCEIFVHRGAGAYICGEETGLIESLEGKRANPRIKPPYFPAVLGLYQCPTIVNNVETMCQVRHVIDMGGEAFSKTGTPGNTGTRIFCVSGHVKRPGYYEFECGKITMGELLYDVCGGPLEGRQFKGVIPGGSSAKVLRFGERFKGKRKQGADMVEFDWGVEDVPMDFDSLAAIGSMGGSGGVIVMDDSVSMVEALANINAFYSHESCGQCTPCREGSLWMKRISSRMVHGQARAEDAALLKSVADQIPGRTICAFGEGCSWPTQSFLIKFKDEFESYYQSKESRPAEALQLV
ncbi:NADH-quinone oxidoreductase subunit F [Cephaloticoccus primus]|uniref:NADH-quinone oxidoreductase subunit F n=1 Tax=Cephaloticoccus primus TaxID=1548207 RepID=A0A139SS70_9BACT|nr:NADH-quinone oxidoreductase subunit NuoF [Cephaloticoccus primus]KXU37445.1 NADH-quinone oxidoreductase subunit F [Cephaloticoccus primus]